MNKFIFLLIFTTFTISLSSQKVSNVVISNSPKNDTVIFTYDIEGVESGKKINVVLWMSTQGSSYREIHSSKVSGNVGIIKPETSGKLSALTLYYVPTGENEQKKQSQKFELRVTEAIPVVVPQLVFVEGAKFRMGSTIGDDDEKPMPDTVVTDFYIGKFEITQGQFEALMGYNPAQKYGVGSQYPVYSVSWWDAVKYCNALSRAEGLAPAYDELTGEFLDQNGEITTDRLKVQGFRLPLEDEWEFAAGGGANPYGKITEKGYLILQKWAGTDNEAALEHFAWFDSNSAGKKRKVGSKKPNRLGLYDMSGGVWEWCSDWHRGYPGSIGITDKTGTYRVYRGGSSYFHPSFCRVAYRSNGSPLTKDYDLGFRIAKSSDGTNPHSVKTDKE